MNLKETIKKIPAHFKETQQVSAVCKGCGCTREEAEERLNHAEMLGDSGENYLRYNGWSLSDEELKTLGRKCEHIEAIRTATGWSWEASEKDLDRAKELGIPNFRYMPYECWKMTGADLEQLGQKCSYIKTIRKATEWKWKKAEAALDRAEKAGVPHSQYVKAKGWKLTEEDIMLLGRKIQAEVSRPNETAAAARDVKSGHDASDGPVSHAETVRAATGWSAAKTLEQMAKALVMGVSNYYYARYQAWQLTEEELKELGSVLTQLKKKELEDDEWFVDIVCVKSGKQKEEVRAHMEEVRKKKGISFMKYARWECFERSESGLNILAAYLEEDSKRVFANKRKYLDLICGVTGWRPAKAELEVAKARLISGASYEDYFACKMYELTPEEQRGYVTYKEFSKVRIKYNMHQRSFRYLNDKAMFNRTYSDCISRRWFVNWDLPYEEFLKKIEGVSDVVTKPLTSTQGMGIQKLDCRTEDKKSLYDRIMAMPASIVEEYIVQHPELMEFCDTSVNTLRVTTLNANGKCNILYAILRTGQGNVADNLHAGGVAAKVDCDTGLVISDAIDLDGNVYAANPYSGKALKGFRVPHWKMVMEICRKIYDRLPGVNLIGWDFAITPDGVDLIEGNPGTSYIVAQILASQEKNGLRSEMVDPYL